MPIFAAPSHPDGPDDRAFKERTIRFHGKDRSAFLVFSSPEPDITVDWVSEGEIAIPGTHPALLMLTFNYTGYFWQGVFGKVGFDVNIHSRKDSLPPWIDMNALLESIRTHQISRNEITKNDSPKNRQELLTPVLSDLNGTPCIRQYVKNGVNPAGEVRYFFLFDQDHVIEIVSSLVDNSERPGLPQSDWRPRAETFSARLLATVKLRIEAAER